MTRLALLASLLPACIIGPGIGDGGRVMSNAKPCVAGQAPCAGCCDGTTCQEGRLAVQCGVDGAQCMACAPNSICRLSSGCSVDVLSRWRVQPYTAKIAATNGSAAWDPPDGKPDPLVALYCPKDATAATALTLPVADTLMPAWTTTMGNCVATAQSLMRDGFGVAVFDDDGNPPLETIAPTSTVYISERHFDVGFAEAKGGNLESLWFKLEKQP